MYSRRFSIVSAKSLFFLFLLPLSYLFVHLKLQHRVEMVSVLIATFFGHLTHDHKIRPLSVENRTRHPYLAEKWRRLAAVAATVCPPRHIGDRQTTTASLSAARLYSTQRRKCRIRYDNILMNSHFKIDSVLNCVMSMSMLLLGATVRCNVIFAFCMLY